MTASTAKPKTPDDERDVSLEGDTPDTALPPWADRSNHKAPDYLSLDDLDIIPFEGGEISLGALTVTQETQIHRRIGETVALPPLNLLKRMIFDHLDQLPESIDHNAFQDAWDREITPASSVTALIAVIRTAAILNSGSWVQMKRVYDALVEFVASFSKNQKSAPLQDKEVADYLGVDQLTRGEAESASNHYATLLESLHSGEGVDVALQRMVDSELIAGVLTLLSNRVSDIRQIMADLSRWHRVSEEAVLAFAYRAGKGEVNGVALPAKGPLSAAQVSTVLNAVGMRDAAFLLAQSRFTKVLPGEIAKK